MRLIGVLLAVTLAGAGYNNDLYVLSHIVYLPEVMYEAQNDREV